MMKGVYRSLHLSITFILMYCTTVFVIEIFFHANTAAYCVHYVYFDRFTYSVYT